MSKEWVELGPTGLAVCIFRNKKAAAHFSVANPDAPIRLMLYKLAVEQIRRQVFKRDGFMCVKCGAELVWEAGRPNSAEMDEVQARGDCQQGDDGEYHSGEVSVENCQTLCEPCHTGPKGKHQRQPQWINGPGL